MSLFFGLRLSQSSQDSKKLAKSPAAYNRFLEKKAELEKKARKAEVPDKDSKDDKFTPAIDLDRIGPSSCNSSYPTYYSSETPTTGRPRERSNTLEDEALAILIRRYHARRRPGFSHEEEAHLAEQERQLPSSTLKEGLTALRRGDLRGEELLSKVIPQFNDKLSSDQKERSRQARIGNTESVEPLERPRRRTLVSKSAPAIKKSEKKRPTTLKKKKRPLPPLTKANLERLQAEEEKKAFIPISPSLESLSRPSSGTSATLNVLDEATRIRPSSKTSQDTFTATESTLGQADVKKPKNRVSPSFIWDVLASLLVMQKAVAKAEGALPEKIRTVKHIAHNGIVPTLLVDV